MNRDAKDKRAIGGGPIILAMIAIPLWIEFHEPDNGAWNVFLAVILGAVSVAAFMLQRFVHRHGGEIGEARFDSHHEGEVRG